MNISPQISVIVTVYNLELYINETLNSVKNQSYQDWECIIVDDGSTDNSETICKEWIEKDSRFIYLKKVNGGTASARNEGLKIAKGYFIQFLDGDDIIDTNKFEIQLKQMENLDISICNYSFFNQDWVQNEYISESPYLNISNIKRDIIINWEHKNSIPIHCILFNRSIIDINKINFCEIFYNREDWLFVVKLFYHAKNIGYCEKILAHYRYRPDSKSKRNSKTRKIEFLKASLELTRYFKEINNTEYHNYAIKKYWLIQKNIYLSYYYRAKFLVKTKIKSVFTSEKKQK